MHEIYEKEYQLIEKLIERSNNIIIIPHVDPDPDALSSAYALFLMLKQWKKNARVALQNSLSGKNAKIFGKFEHFNKSTLNNNTNYDLAIIVDIGSYKRIGKYIDLFDKSLPIINLDHHIGNECFGEVSIVDSSYSSTCELIYELLKFLKILITEKMAYILYLGIVSDTGSFRYDLTSSKTHRITSDLLKYKINTNEVFEQLFEQFTLQTLKLKNKVTDTIELLCNGEIALSYIKRDFIVDCENEYKDNVSLIPIGNSIVGVLFSIFLNERENNIIKVSLRSKNKIRVNEIANNYGGGGHQKAAGFIIKDDNFDNALKKIKKEIVEFYKKEKEIHY